MKFNMMIGGIETFFPETDVRYFKEDNEIIIYFLNIKKDKLKHIENNIKNSTLKIEGNYLILLLNDIQYAHDLNNSPKLMQTYLSGADLGFAFEDENGNILDIATPRYSNAI